MINSDTGEVTLPYEGYSFWRGYTWQDFLSSGLYESSAALPYRFLKVRGLKNVPLLGAWLSLELYFEDDKLISISWMTLYGTEHQTWSDWTREKQALDMNLAKSILDKDLGEPQDAVNLWPNEKSNKCNRINNMRYTYTRPWGMVSLFTERISGDYSVIVKYADDNGNVLRPYSATN